MLVRALVEPRFALDHQHKVFVLEKRGVCQEDLVLQPIAHVVQLLECGAREVLGFGYGLDGLAFEEKGGNVDSILVWSERDDVVDEVWLEDKDGAVGELNERSDLLEDCLKHVVLFLAVLDCVEDGKETFNTRCIEDVCVLGGDLSVQRAVTVRATQGSLLARACVRRVSSTHAACLNRLLLSWLASQPAQAEKGLLGEAGDLLEVLAVALERGCELGVLLLQGGKLTLSRVLLLLDRFEFVLGSLYLLLDVREEQVLVERVDVAHGLVLHQGDGPTRLLVGGRAVLARRREDRIATVNGVGLLLADLVLTLIAGLPLVQLLQAVLAEHGVLRLIGNTVLRQHQLLLVRRDLVK